LWLLVGYEFSRASTERDESSRACKQALTVEGQCHLWGEGAQAAAEAQERRTPEVRVLVGHAVILSARGGAVHRRQVRRAPLRCSDMGHDRDRLIGYCSRLVSGLVALAVIAATLHEDVAALTILSAVLAVLGITSVMQRDRRL
jgi:hypothetical protein